MIALCFSPFLMSSIYIWIKLDVIFLFRVGGWTQEEFSRTPIMSTYILAFIVSDFDCVDSHTVSGTLVSNTIRDHFLYAMHPANEIWRYTVTPSLIGWVHTQNDSWQDIEALSKRPSLCQTIFSNPFSSQRSSLYWFKLKFFLGR